LLHEPSGMRERVGGTGRSPAARDEHGRGGEGEESMSEAHQTGPLVASFG
jgi:hypothetical protein